jgi:long-chain acyl-CoA synthetase
MRILHPDKEGRGEVLFLGATVFAGYYGNEQATRQVFDSDGFFHTGDLGRVSKDGFLYLTGRAKDVIVLPSGKNVYPEQLEAFYSQSRLIEEIGIFGVNDGAGEAAAAVILPSKELRKRYGPEEVKEILLSELRRMDKHRPSYNKITDFLLARHPLPRTSTRKIKKGELLLFYEENRRSAREKEGLPVTLTVAEEELMKTAEYREIAGVVLAGRKNQTTPRVTPRSNLELDLKMDSLSRIDFFSWLEKKTGRGLQEETMLKMETVQDAVQWMIESKSMPGAAATSAAAVPPQDISAIMGRIKDNRAPVFLFGPMAAGVLSRLLWGLTVRGAEAVPSDSPVIFCANHASYLDAAWIVSALPWKVRRKTFALGKIELLSNPVTAFLVRRCNMVAVEREGDIVTPLVAAENILKDGRNLLVFPEGTRSRTGRTGPFRSGVGMLMIKTGIPAVPVKVTGSFALWPAGGTPQFLAGRGIKPALKFGPVLKLKDLGDTGKGALTERAEAVSGRLKRVIDEM